MKPQLTRAEYDQLSSELYYPLWFRFGKSQPTSEEVASYPACPDCGLRQTHPTPGCWCGRVHIMKFHHTCPPVEADPTDQAA